MESRSRVVPVSGLEVRVLVGELSTLRGRYVSSVHSLGENQVMLLKGPEGDSDVVVSPVYGTWITSQPARGETREFTTGVRRMLERWKLERVEQLGLDRVVFFRFTDGVDTRQLIMELIPPGNIVITDAQGEVLLSLREYKGQHRTIARGRKYAPPPRGRSSLDEVDEQSLESALTAEKTVGQAVGRGFSLPRRYVEEILARASLTQEERTPLQEQKLSALLSAMRDLAKSLSNPSPSLVKEEGKLELMCVSPSSGSSRLVESAERMSTLMDRVFIPPMLENQEKREEDQRVKETMVTIGRLSSQVSRLRESATRSRALASQVRGAASSEEARSIVDNSDLEEATKKVIKDRESQASMASRLYDDAKSAEAEAARIEEVSAGLASKLKRAQRVKPKSTVKTVTREKREWYEKFRWFFTSAGKLAVGGRDAQSNAILLKRHAENGDVVYHADLFGSPFFVLKGGAGQTPDEIREVGQATAAFSSAWKTGLSAADSYWINPEQVSSSAPSGEYLARGSFLIRGKKNFVLRNPVEVAVGIDSAGRLASGPERAIMKECIASLVLIPSREKSSDTAKKVLFELRKLYGEQTSVELDDVMRALPTGGGKLVRRKERKTSETAPSGQDY